MRRNWLRVFLLCVACAVCLQGLCLSKDRNWVEYHRVGVDGDSKYYVDITSIQACEFSGRKYLGANVEIGGSPLRIAIDVENRKFVVLEGRNHVTGKMIHNDMSQMISFSGIPIYEILLHWVEQNRPDVIQEIRNFNSSAATGNAESSVQPLIDISSDSGAAGELPYRDTSSGKIEFLPSGWLGQGFVAIWKHNPNGRDYKSEIHGGAYAVHMGDYFPEGHGIDNEGIDFDYDPETETFTACYTINDFPEHYYFNMRVIDHNTVYIEWLEPNDSEWERKINNPAYQVSAPVVRQASPDCPHPTETYSFQKVNGGVLNQVNDNPNNPGYLYRFVSEYGISDARKGQGVLKRTFLGPIIEALIAFYEADGAVEDYPKDVGGIGFF